MRLVKNSDDNYGIKTTGKVSALWICRILFFGCFFVAIFLANTVWKNEAAWFGYLHETNLLGSVVVPGEGNSTILYLVLYRMPMLIVLMVFGKCLFGMLVAELYAGWQGFALGLALTIFLLRYGLTGVIVFVLSGCPQLFVYCFVYWIFYKMICKLYRQKRMLADSNYNGGDTGPDKRSYLGICIVLIILFLMGIFLESYVNVLLIDKIAMILSNR